MHLTSTYSLVMEILSWFSLSEKDMRMMVHLVAPEVGFAREEVVVT